MSPVMSNTQKGLVQKPTTNTTLTKGLLVQLKSVSSGLAFVDLATGDGQRVDFLAIEDSYADDAAGLTTGGGGSTATNLITCQPLDSNQSVRIVANGTITAGTVVMVEANTGKIKTLSGTNIYSVGVLEEDCVAGQFALVRPVVWHY